MIYKAKDYYLYDPVTDEVWSVVYKSKNYTTNDTPDVERCAHGLLVMKKLHPLSLFKSFDDVVSLWPYPQLP